MRFPANILLLSLGLSVALLASFSTGSYLEGLRSRFSRAMEMADRVMRRDTHQWPQVFANGGGCFSGYGRLLPPPSCRSALEQMPAEGIAAGAGYRGPHMFTSSRPLIWRHGDCLIGVSTYRVDQVEGLYPLFRQAAGLIVDRCVARQNGGLVRFAPFEVVVFDARLLPGYERQDVDDFLFDFSSRSENMPFSRGLQRLQYPFHP
ncbi:hypothetical protein MMC13_000305 [Lambiella insularis]|nr:hypothetical protein [Lambiella insularis]